MYTSIHHAFAFGSRFGEKRKKERERVANAKLRELEITPVSLRREAGRAAELRDVASLIARDSVGQSLLWNVRDEISHPLPRGGVSGALSLLLLALEAAVLELTLVASADRARVTARGVEEPLTEGLLLALCTRSEKRRDAPVSRGVVFVFAKRETARETCWSAVMFFCQLAQKARVGLAILSGTPPPSPRHGARCSPRVGAIDVRSAPRRS